MARSHLIAHGGATCSELPSPSSKRPLLEHRHLPPMPGQMTACRGEGVRFSVAKDLLDVAWDGAPGHQHSGLAPHCLSSSLLPGTAFASIFSVGSVQLAGARRELVLSFRPFGAVADVDNLDTACLAFSSLMVFCGGPLFVFFSHDILVLHSLLCLQSHVLEVGKAT